MSPTHKTDKTDKTKHRTTSSDVGQEADEEVVTQRHGLVAFGRRHPMLSIAGLASIGLFGGVELAAGMLLGAGAAALLRRRRDEVTGASSEAPGHIRQVLIERARAVMHAARGDTGAPASAPSPHA